MSKYDSPIAARAGAGRRRGHGPGGPHGIQGVHEETYSIHGAF